MQVNVSSLIREAATVILVRQGLENLEVFMLKRPRRGVFPELHVFPGGKVDEDDQRLSQSYGDLFAQTRWGIGPPMKFAVTAVRECFEEAGILFVEGSLESLDVQAEFNKLRLDLLNSTTTFVDIHNQISQRLDFGSIHYFSHWITPATAPVRFNTRFFVANVPTTQEASHHLSETDEGCWINPSQALRNVATKRWQMIVPTITTLRMIAGYQSVTHLIDDVRRGKHRIPITAALHAQGMQYFESK